MNIPLTASSAPQAQYSTRAVHSHPVGCWVVVFQTLIFSLMVFSLCYFQHKGSFFVTSGGLTAVMLEGGGRCQFQVENLNGNPAGFAIEPRPTGRVTRGDSRLSAPVGLSTQQVIRPQYFAPLEFAPGPHPPPVPISRHLPSTCRFPHAFLHGWGRLGQGFPNSRGHPTLPRRRRGGGRVPAGC